MVWKTKLIIDVEVDTYSMDSADRRWRNVLEKLKYQTSNVKITQQLDPNWILVPEKEVKDELGTDQPTG